MVVPVFVLDDEMHLRCKPPAQVRRLHSALAGLERRLDEAGLPLLFIEGNAADVVAQLASDLQPSLDSFHVVEDDVEHTIRSTQRQACARLRAQGVHVERWSNALRELPETLPRNFAEYGALAASCALRPPSEAALEAAATRPEVGTSLNVGPLPPLERLLGRASDLTPAAVREARAQFSTSEPFAEALLPLAAESEACAALEEYCATGRANFANRWLPRAHPAAAPAPSLHAAAAQWLLDGGVAAERTALREPAVRAFAPALSLGSLSARRLVGEAARVSVEALSPANAPIWSRSDLGCLTDVAEWREWHRLHAARELEQIEAEIDAETEQEAGRAEVRYWRWGGQHLVRYMTWEGSATMATEGSVATEAEPALVFVHGFAASSAQWGRLVAELRAEAARTATALPPMYAFDLLGFGHSEAPGLSYTQHLWEAQLVDFVQEVLGGRPVLLVGNSIGGGLSAGSSSNLGELCRGLVLCNTAGSIVDPAEYEAQRKGGAPLVGEATLAGELEAKYSPVPLGQPLLDAFGAAVITLLKPRIPTLLKSYYPTNPANADAGQAATIARDASDPGAANVIGSGQKLPPQRTLNEVLSATDGFSGPVLVPQGTLDPLTGAARAQLRAKQLAQLREGVSVRSLQAGHCPHDEVPDEVAREIVAWLPTVL